MAKKEIEREYWADGENPDGKIIGLDFDSDLVHEPPKAKAKGGMTKDFYGLSQLGDQYEGECIGYTDEGDEVIAKVSIYIKKPQATTSKRTTGFAVTSR